MNPGSLGLVRPKAWCNRRPAEAQQNSSLDKEMPYFKKSLIAIFSERIRFRMNEKVKVCKGQWNGLLQRTERTS